MMNEVLAVITFFLSGIPVVALGDLCPDWLINGISEVLNLIV